MFRFLQRWTIRAGLAVMRRYWRLAHPLSVGIRAVVRDGEGRILLARHVYGDDKLHLPGGGVKRRETLVDALVRELREETGLVATVDPTELLLLGVYSNFSEGKSDHVTVFVVEADQWHGTVEPDGVEVAGLTFASAADLPDNVSDGTRRRIAELLGEREVTFRW